MTWIPALGKRPAALHLVRALIVILIFLSSRTASFASSAPAYDGKRPRPSKQALPTDPVRPALDPECERDRKPAPLGTSVGALPSPGDPPTLSAAGRLHLRTESTKPHYLQFFQAAGLPHPLAPPA